MPLGIPGIQEVSPVAVSVEDISSDIGDEEGETNDGLFTDGDDPSQDIYPNFRCRNYYDDDPHVYQMPITSPDGFQNAKVAFVQLAHPTLRWICDWTVARLGKQPVIPDPTPADSNWVLLYRRLEPVNVVVAADGRTVLYRVNGTYVYGHKNPDKQVLKHVNFGRPPWLRDEIDRTMPESTLTKSLVDSQQSTVLYNPIGK